MATDDIQTTNPATGGTSDALAFQGPGVPVSAEALERWTRAVTTPPALKDQDAEQPAVSTKPDPHQPAQAQARPGTDRFHGALQPPSTFNTVRHGQSAPTPTGLDGSLSSPMASVQAQSGANGFLAGTRSTGDAVDQAAQAAPSLAAASRPVAPHGMAAVAVGPTRATFAAPASNTAQPLKDGEQPADAAFSASVKEAPEHVQNLGTALRGAEPIRSDHVGRRGDTVLRSQPALVQNELEGARALPLSTLRGMHANHRFGRLDAAASDSVNTEHSSRLQTTPNVTADLLMPRVQALPSADVGVASDGVSPVGGKEQLHALIESCCSRLWVSDGGGRAAPGVMLDLGRWMPGCTVEVARASGGLRITLRGVDGADRARLEEELQGLGDGLAEKLGCKVVAAVSTNKELT